MELYEFLEGLFNKSELKERMDLDQFIGGFLAGSLGVSSVREGFVLEDYLCNYDMDYEIDHGKREVKLLFVEV